MEQVLAGYLAAVNLAAFLLMGADKRRARRGGWRVSEKTLFLFPALGGALGGLLGMKAAPGPDGAWAGSPEALKRGVYT